MTCDNRTSGKLFFLYNYWSNRLESCVVIKNLKQEKGCIFLLLGDINWLLKTITSTHFLLTRHSWYLCMDHRKSYVLLNEKKWPHKTIRKYCVFIGNVFVFRVTGPHRAVISHKPKTSKTPSTKRTNRKCLLGKQSSKLNALCPMW